MLNITKIQIREFPTHTRAVWSRFAVLKSRAATKDSLQSSSLRWTSFQDLKRNVLNRLLRWHISQVNTTISFYNGIRARPEDFNPDTWETNNYKVCVILRGMEKTGSPLALPQASEAGNLSRHAGATKKIKTTFRYLTRRTCLLGRLIYQSGLR